MDLGAAGSAEARWSMGVGRQRGGFDERLEVRSTVKSDSSQFPQVTAISIVLAPKIAFRLSQAHPSIGLTSRLESGGWRCRSSLPRWRPPARRFHCMAGLPVGDGWSGDLSGGAAGRTGARPRAGRCRRGTSDRGRPAGGNPGRARRASAEKLALVDEARLRL